MVFKTELQPREVYAGTSFDSFVADLKRLVNGFRCPISADIEALCLGTINPDVCFDAYYYAYLRHNGQTRLDGAPYRRHPVGVAKILYEAGIRYTGIIAPAFLHDVIEGKRPVNGSLSEIRESDRKYVGEIERKFGWDIASVVQTLTPLPKTYYTKEQRDAEMFQRLRELGDYDLRSLLIKGADGLQNLLPNEIALMDDNRAITYAKYSRAVLMLLQENLPELGFYSKWREDGIRDGLINPLEERTNAVIAERSARLAEQREMAGAGISTEIVPAN